MTFSVFIFEKSMLAKDDEANIYDISATFSVLKFSRFKFSKSAL